MFGLFAAIDVARSSSDGRFDHLAGLNHQALLSQACVYDGQYPWGEFVFLQQMTRQQTELMAFDAY